MRAVNLLPESSRAHRPTEGMTGSAYAIVGVLAVLLVMAVVYVLTTNGIGDKESKIAAANAEAEQARARAGSFTAFSDFAQVKEARLASVRGLAGVRFDWERLMREVSHVIPDDVWLLDMTASSAPQDSSGETAAATTDTATGASATPATPSLNLSGCAKSQDSVANLMVRLRQLHRADDVELSQSTRAAEAGAAAAATDSAASGEGCPTDRYQFQVSVTFTAPAPADESAERVVPASLGGGS